MTPKVDLSPPNSQPLRSTTKEMYSLISEKKTTRRLGALESKGRKAGHSPEYLYSKHLGGRGSLISTELQDSQGNTGRANKERVGGRRLALVLTMV